MAGRSRASTCPREFICATPSRSPRGTGRAGGQLVVQAFPVARPWEPVRTAAAIDKRLAVGLLPKLDQVLERAGAPFRSCSQTASASAAAKSQWPSTERGSSTAELPARVRSRTRHSSRCNWSWIGQRDRVAVDARTEQPERLGLARRAPGAVHDTRDASFLQAGLDEQAGVLIDKNGRVAELLRQPGDTVEHDGRHVQPFLLGFGGATVAAGSFRLPPFRVRYDEPFRVVTVAADDDRRGRVGLRTRRRSRSATRCPGRGAVRGSGLARLGRRPLRGTRLRPRR